MIEVQMEKLLETFNAKYEELNTKLRNFNNTHFNEILPTISGITVLVSDWFDIYNEIEEKVCQYLGKPPESIEKTHVDFNLLNIVIRKSMEFVKIRDSEEFIKLRLLDINNLQYRVKSLATKYI
jgi:hypothetical protein